MQELESLKGKYILPFACDRPLQAFGKQGLAEFGSMGLGFGVAIEWEMTQDVPSMDDGVLPQAASVLIRNPFKPKHTETLNPKP